MTLFTALILRLVNPQRQMYSRALVSDWDGVAGQELAAMRLICTSVSLFLGGRQ